MAGPRLEQRLTLHLNGGSDFSECHYEIRADGAATGIVRLVRTDGSPGYRKTVDVLRHGADCFDVLAAQGRGVREWITSRLVRAAGPP